MNSYDMKKVNKWLDKRKIYDIRLIYFNESFSFVIWPMILACDDNELDACKYMYENGAADHIHKIDEVYGYNTMIISCLSGNLEICKWLYDMGAQNLITKKNIGDRTPMFHACEKGHLHVCEWLYEKGAHEDIFLPNNFGRTPMHIACYNNHLSVCKWLFKNGVVFDKDNLKDNLNCTAMSLAMNNNSISVCKWLFLILPLDQQTQQHLTIAPETRPEIEVWVKDILSTHNNFFKLILYTYFLRNSSLLGKLCMDNIKLISSFVGVKTGNSLKLIREINKLYN